VAPAGCSVGPMSVAPLGYVDPVTPPVAAKSSGDSNEANGGITVKFSCR